MTYIMGHENLLILIVSNLPYYKNRRYTDEIWNEKVKYQSAAFSLKFTLFIQLFMYEGYRKNVRSHKYFININERILPIVSARI